MERVDLLDHLPPAGSQRMEGLLKVKLVHAMGATCLIPDLVAIDLGVWRWFQPKYFSAPMFSFLDEAASCRFNIDTDRDVRLIVDFSNDRLIRTFVDGSHLYRCNIWSNTPLVGFESGVCEIRDNAPILRLYHHTRDESKEAILQAGYFFGSKWNLQGVRKLENIEYVYFTGLSAIRSDADLVKIAMASQGRIRLLPTNGEAPRDVLEIPVYRANTLDRTATLSFAVPAEIVATQHVWRHAPRGGAVYYEASHPSIARVGLFPGARLAFSGVEIRPVGNELKHFEYVILGDAETRAGLVAPYDEEGAESLFHIESCPTETFFEFWRRHANTDQHSSRHPELLRFI